MGARGHSQDYQAWARSVAEPIWQQQSLMRHFRSVESRLPQCSPKPADSAHSQAFFRACERAGQTVYRGHALGEDANGAGYLRRVTSQARRWTRNSYLRPAIQASGPDGQQLEVLSDVRALRVKVENGRAVGIEMEGGCVGATEVILCAGAVGSPQLLLNSGIGPRADLEALGIPVTMDLPGVGANYQDHLRFSVQDPTSRASVSSFYGNLTGVRRQDSDAEFVPGGYFNVQASSTSPDMFVVLRGGIDAPLSLLASLTRTHTRGRITLSEKAAQSGQTLPSANLQYDPLDAAIDVEALVRAVRLARSILNGMAGVEALNVNEQEDGIVDFLRRSCLPAQTAVGTCAMGHCPMSVVNGRLEVHGISGLRVVDSSVMPSTVSADPHGSVIAIAEIASTLLASSMDLYKFSQHGQPPVESILATSAACA